MLGNMGMTKYLLEIQRMSNSKEGDLCSKAGVDGVVGDDDTSHLSNRRYLAGAGCPPGEIRHEWTGDNTVVGSTDETDGKPSPTS